MMNEKANYPITLPLSELTTFFVSFLFLYRSGGSVVGWGKQVTSEWNVRLSEISHTIYFHPTT